MAFRRSAVSGTGLARKHSVLEPRGYFAADGITNNRDDTEKQPEGPIRFCPGVRIVFVFITRMQNLPALHAQATESQATLKVRRNIGGIGKCRHGNTWKDHSAYWQPAQKPSVPSGDRHL
jgi:hypothetical protein